METEIDYLLVCDINCLVGVMTSPLYLGLRNQLRKCLVCFVQVWLACPSPGPRGRSTRLLTAHQERCRDPSPNYLVSWWGCPAMLERGCWSLGLDVEGGDGGQDPYGWAKSQRTRGKHGCSSLLCTALVLRSWGAAR